MISASPHPPRYARLLPALALLLLTAGFAGGAGAADKVSNAQLRAASEFLAAVATGDPRAVAYAIHPDDLEALRLRIVALLQEEAKRNDSTVRSRLFGRGMPLADIERLTSIGFYAALGERLHITAREFRDTDGIAAIPDRGDVVLIVLRGDPPRDRGEVRVVDLVAVKPYGKDWKATVPSDIEAQIEDLIAGRSTGAPRRAGLAAPAPGSGAPTPPAITALLSEAEKTLDAGECERYYDKHISPNFRRMTSKKAFQSLIATCENSLGNRQMLLSTVRIVRGLEPRMLYEGTRAVYDVSGQGLPFNRFVLEQVDDRWYIAE